MCTRPTSSSTSCMSTHSTPMFACQVRAAYSSGHPALGVGAGNTPAVIDETADVQMAVSSILLSKTFDSEPVVWLTSS